MKKITKLSTVILSSLLVLLGFGGCKSGKRAAKEESQAAKDSSSVTNIPGRHIQIRPDDPTRMRVLYGPPPSRYRNNGSQAK